ncbi:glycosyltransferase [Mycobacterium crocinum]|uniref:Glycosyltransferase n=1 Tax=Mycolicibacterium crocinum TaxID=388459 RepID=A0ABY3TL76_9MYCO|nr:glycosyltransferase [Mycolicibacterium crocinum]MCV7217311.1 glycosyltransferase [Mycolicibacterium crocinum]ULN42210.1 glycosyltransferase [Mycolicibacterium crocinum]
MSDSVANAAAPRIGVAITTVGRWDELRGLLDGLASQSRPPHAVAIAHHDAAAEDDLAALVGEFSDKLAIMTVVSPRGISNGRNAAAGMFGDDVDWLWFPNDTSRIDPDFLERIAPHLTPDAVVCAVQLVDREGPRNTLPPPGTPLNRRNVWGPIEPATLFRRREFLQAGGFDPAIGSGAGTPWQAGEGTDLLLRMSEQDGFSIAWVDDIAVRAQTEFAHLTAKERRRKIRCYGRGTGYLYRRWNYPAWQRFRHVVGAALMPLRNSDKFQLQDGMALAVGRAEGIFGRVVPGDQDNRAIVR